MRYIQMKQTEGYNRVLYLLQYAHPIHAVYTTELFRIIWNIIHSIANSLAISMIDQVNAFETFYNERKGS